MPENPKDIQKMQLDAERRIREMQRRSDNYLHNNDRPPVPNFSNTNQYRHNEQPTSQGFNESKINQNQQSHKNQPQNRQQAHPPTKTVIEPIQSPPSQHKSGFLSRFKGFDILKIFNFQNLRIDNDVLIIVALIFLLSTEETDELLLMALIYIML